MAKRVLITLSPEVLEHVERLHKEGIGNARFGCAPRSLSETLRRLIIEGLESNERRVQ